ncbi:peptide-N4-asparagine amidase [Streptomyces sp. NPDC059278]|uniref:peptide-N4-asparagine amidase n=1 Tax=Streptomyces sp. NPDC059278 TaxID=3346801 RepID=UPI0036BB2F85
MFRHRWVRALRRISVVSASIALAGGALAVPAEAGSAPKPGSNPAVDYQDPVDALPPVSRPDTEHCAVTAVDHEFGNTLGGPPYTTTLTPPDKCRGPWNKVVLDWSASVKGRQYDRLAAVFVGGAEIFRTSTAEPDDDGISWHVAKDITDFAPLLKDLQKLQLELGNVVNDTYTGVYKVKLTITYYRADKHHPAAKTADRIVPLGDTGSTGAPWATVGKGGSTSTDVTFPRNLTAARLQVYARGGGCDEQWFDAVPSDLAATAPDYLCGGGPYREVQIAVDGRPAGLAQPYPVVYSGGIVPTLWRPVPAIDQFRTEAYDIDLTPFAGELADGRPHAISITPYGAADSWIVDGSLFLRTDAHAARTGGRVTVDTLTDRPVVKTVQTPRGDGSTHVAVSTGRSWKISGYVRTSKGRVTTTVEQNFSYTNEDTVSRTGQQQTMHQRDHGATTVTTKTGTRTEARRHAWSYPIDVDMDTPLYGDYNNYELKAAVTQRRVLLDTSRTGHAHRWRTDAVTDDTVDTTGSLARENGAVRAADGASSETYRGTTDTGACYSRSLTTAHGWVTGDRQSRCRLADVVRGALKG